MHLFPSPQELLFQVVLGGILAAAHRLVASGHAKVLPAAVLVWGATTAWFLAAGGVLAPGAASALAPGPAAGLGGVFGLLFALGEWASRSRYWSRNIL